MYHNIQPTEQPTQQYNKHNSDEAIPIFYVLGTFKDTPIPSPYM